MSTHNVADARAHPNDLINKAEAGEEVIITRRGIPVIRLERIARKAQSLPLETLRAFLASEPCSQFTELCRLTTP